MASTDDMASAPSSERTLRKSPHDSLRSDALACNISLRLGACSHDELRVLDQMLARLELGRDRYGHLDLARAKDWERELAEELLDVVVYKAIAKVLERDRAVAAIESAPSCRILVDALTREEAP